MRQTSTGTAQPREWFSHFGVGKTHQLNAGDEVYVQYRYWTDAPALNHSFWPGGGGFKQDLLSLGDIASCNAGGPISSQCTTTCQGPTFVTQNSSTANWVDGYMNCGGSGVIPTNQPFTHPAYSDGTNLFEQNAFAPGCISGQTPTDANCVMYHSGEWMTFKKYVKMGHFNQFDTIIKLWAGHQGQPLQLVFACGTPEVASRPCNYGHDGGTGSNGALGWLLFMPSQICDGSGGNCSPGSAYRLGKVYLISYQTCEDSTLCGGLWPGAPTTNIWYDELIISTQDIPDPSSTASPTLSVTFPGNGAGTVTSSPAGLSCNTNCSASFPTGTHVILTANPTSGTFTGWGGACTGTGTCDIPSLTASTTVSATFTLPNATLQVSKAGTGTGTVTTTSNPTQASQINCGATCGPVTYPTNTTITLSATPDSGMQFTSWSGSCVGTNLTCTFTLTGPASVTATFAPQTGGQITGLQWDGTGPFRRMLYWSNPFPIYPATYLFKVMPHKKIFNQSTNPPECPGTRTGYYTTFFWGNNGRFDWISPSNGDMFYGGHPYPAGNGGPPCGTVAGTTSASAGDAAAWELTMDFKDCVNDGCGDFNAPEVQWDRFFQQAFRVTRVDAQTTIHEFYFDWDPTWTAATVPACASVPARCLTQTIVSTTWATQTPPHPAIVMGQAPDFGGVGSSTVSWGGYPAWEEFNGVIRGIQIYSSELSLADIVSEIALPQSSAAGNASIWYLNLNPTPTDVTDKKVGGTPHNPLWDGVPAQLFTSGGGGGPTPPGAPTGFQIVP